MTFGRTSSQHPPSSSSFLVCFFKLHKSNQRNLPPSPPSLPIIGHLLLIKERVHRTLQSLSHSYGPVLSLSFGSRPVVVVSSPSAAEECFTRNNAVLASRPRTLFAEILGYSHTVIGTTSYGPLWCNLRRLTALQILSPPFLASSVAVRLEEVRLLVKSFYKEVAATATGGGGGCAKVEMRSRLQDLSFNIIMRMISGKRYFGAAIDTDDAEVARQFTEVIKEIFELSGTDPGDFLPALRKVVDFKGERAEDGGCGQEVRFDLAGHNRRAEDEKEERRRGPRGGEQDDDRSHAVGGLLGRHHQRPNPGMC